MEHQTLVRPSGGRRWLLPLNGCTSRIMGGDRRQKERETMAEAIAEIKVLIAVGIMTPAEARRVIARIEDAR